jgi:hypothetical protein
MVRGLMLRHHVGHALGVVLLHALVLGLFSWAVDAWLPWLLGPALWLAAGWLAYMLLRELLGLLRRHRRLRVEDVDQGLGMQDMLTTLWTDRRHGALSDWLRRDVAMRLARVPASQRRGLWWRGCRRGLVLLPLLVLVIWLGPFWRLLPFGLKPSGGNTPDQVATQAGSEGGKGQGAASKPSSPAGQQPGPQPEPRPRPEPQPVGAGKPGGGAQPPPGPRTQPKPLIAALPTQKEFVVPTWIHEGPSTKGKAPVVEMEQPERPPGPPRQMQRPEEAKRSPQQLEDFQRAAERAQHARHVPPAERPFVRRYFGELVESGRGR